jgi:protocatechuate 3,4-dioxygenase beta subunit
MGISHSWSRRGFIVKSAASAALWELRQTAWALGLPEASSVCSLGAEQEVGPYYVANELLRNDIREGKPGLPLTLRLAVMDVRTCKPLPQAAIDVWHCDALGVYGGFTKMDPTVMGPGGPPPRFGEENGTGGHPGPPPEFDAQHPDGPGGIPPAMEPTDQMTFLRGIQFTNAQGITAFETVFPGFYMGRTNHIHFKVRQGGRLVTRQDASQGERTYMEGHTAHTGQVFFPEEFTAELMRHEPYSNHRIHRTTQAEDGVFQSQHGTTSMAKLSAVDAGRPEAGYIADLIVAVDPASTPRPVEMRRPGGSMPSHGE